MRALSTANISFGLVSIPVKMFSAADSAAAIRFNQIDRRDGSRLKQQMISAKTGEVVPKGEIVKGYEFAKDQYVLFTPDELKVIEAAATHTIDIVEFVQADQVDRLYLDKVYYLAPDRGTARAYHLLSRALLQTKRVAIAKYAARGKQYLVMVRPLQGGLCMEQLKYVDEVRTFDQVPMDEAEVKKQELKLAVQLIDQASADSFSPQQYRDEVREKMLELIQRKVDGEDITVTPIEVPENKIIDMMEALKASIAAGKKEKITPKPVKRAGKRSTAKKKIAVR